MREDELLTPAIRPRPITRLCHNAGVEIPAELADSWDAAVTDADLIHHDLCHTDPKHPDWCFCGVPKLLRDLNAAFMSWSVARLVGEQHAERGK